MAKKAWSGVFSQATDRRVEQFTESISFDRRLYAHDIAASIAHAQMLAKVGLINAEECRQIEQGLQSIRHEIEQGKFEFHVELEDIHLHIERALIERIGDAGRKLHTARSRNDQVSTDLRLWCRDAIDQLDEQLSQLQRAFVDRCPADLDAVLPGYTHMQRAQPVLAAHYWLAYCEKLDRDRDRLGDCRRRVNVLPLGSAALAGTSLPIDRADVARRLGFIADEPIAPARSCQSPTSQPQLAANSIDATSDRDFVIELAFVLAMIAEHLSGWADEWILWSTAEFNFIKLPEAFCTGSSIMPQKINPDVLELIRGKTARVIGNLQALLVLVKGLAAGLQPRFAGRQRATFRFVRHGASLPGISGAAGAGNETESAGDRGETRPRLSRRHDVDGRVDPPERPATQRPRNCRQAGAQSDGPRRAA